MPESISIRPSTTAAVDNEHKAEPEWNPCRPLPARPSQRAGVGSTEPLRPRARVSAIDRAERKGVSSLFGETEKLHRH